ncbi:hypothetical protein AAVH_39785 [Aphelenchoides avenae]|nr:hypothetical protein AAVH_39785 [Aphelenchus avenae]
MESSPLSNNEHQAMEHVNVGHEEVSNADAHTGAIFGMNALRVPGWLVRTDLRRQLVRALLGVGLLLIGALIGLWLGSHAPSTTCDSAWTPHAGYCYKVS